VERGCKPLPANFELNIVLECKVCGMWFTVGSGPLKKSLKDKALLIYARANANLNALAIYGITAAVLTDDDGSTIRKELNK
jgi:hypothetical protein